MTADFNDVVAREAVEPLILLEMKVLRGAAFPAAWLLGEKERASGVLRRDLDEQQAAIRKFQSLSMSAFAGRNLDSDTGRIGRLLLRQDARGKGRHGPEECSTENCSVTH